MDDAIVALRKHTMAVLDAEMEKVRSHHGCTGAEDQIEMALRRMVRSLLHTPTVRAKQLASQGRADEYITGLEALYGIEVDAPAHHESHQNPPADQSPSTTARNRAVG